MMGFYMMRIVIVYVLCLLDLCCINRFCNCRLVCC